MSQSKIIVVLLIVRTCAVDVLPITTERLLALPRLARRVPTGASV